MRIDDATGTVYECNDIFEAQWEQTKIQRENSEIVCVEDHFSKEAGDIIEFIDLIPRKKIVRKVEQFIFENREEDLFNFLSNAENLYQIDESDLYDVLEMLFQNDNISNKKTIQWLHNDSFLIIFGDVIYSLIFSIFKNSSKNRHVLSFLDNSTVLKKLQEHNLDDIYVFLCEGESWLSKRSIKKKVNKILVKHSRKKIL